MRLLDTPTRRLRISLTPLIDVVFILLLFFMLSTQFSRQQVLEVNVISGKAGPATSEQSSLQLHLFTDGTISVDEQRTSSAETIPLHPAVLSAIEEATPIQLNADDTVSLQQLLTLSDSLKQAGASVLSLSALR